MIENRILLVEDDPDIREILTLALRREGYAVDAAGTEAEAVEQLVEHRYRLIIMNSVLPHESGKVIAKIAAVLNIKMFLIGGSLAADRAAGHRTFTKPFRMRELVAAVQRSIGRPLGSSHSGLSGFTA
jgi:two-component system, OmpR family, response regulator